MNIPLSRFNHIRLKKIEFIFITAIILFISAHSHDGNQLVFFNKQDSIFSLHTLDFTNHVEYGVYTKKKFSTIHMGFDFPTVGLRQNTRVVSHIGLYCLVHTYLFPRGAVFHVDNFYGSFGFYIQTNPSTSLNLRVYPYYHLSAHLADGYLYSNSKLTGIISIDKKTVSNEMLYVSFLSLHKKKVQIAGGAGYYYHTIYRKDLVARLDFSVLFSPQQSTFFVPLLWSRTELLYERHLRPGIEFFAGFISRQSIYNSKCGIGFHYGNKVHPGQYCDESNHKSYGLMVYFIP